MQSQIRATLASVGYATFEIGTARKMVKCPKPECGETFYPIGYAGNTPGVPDLLAYRNAQGFPAIAILIEVKVPDGQIRPAQKTLHDSGRSYICYSCSDALAAVRDAENALSTYTTPTAHRLRLAQFETK